MVPSQLRARVVLDRLAGIRSVLANIRALPLDSYDSFCTDPRSAAAAESYLRRGLEMMLDLGRHMLAKGFARSPSEYKAIARELEAVGVLDAEEGRLLREMAGYRNRLVHFYDEVTTAELYEVCTKDLRDIERLAESFERWIREHPDRIDQAI